MFRQHILLFLLFLFFRDATACEIKSFSNIYVTEISKLNLSDVVSGSTCSNEVNDSFLQALKGINGNIPAQSLREKMNLPNQTLTIFPEIISIRSVSDLLKEQLSVNAELFLTNVRILNGKESISLSKDERIEISCENCSSPGTKSIQVKLINNKEKMQIKNFWIGLDIMTNTKVLVLKDDIPHMSGISLIENIIEEVRPINGPELYFKKIDDLRFFELNRPLRKGTAIKLTDLRPRQLIKSGEKVKVIVRSNDLHITGTAIAKKNSYWGEQIEVYNLSNSKKIVGKVIDYNTIMTEL